MSQHAKITQYVLSGNISLAIYQFGAFQAKRETVVLIHGYPDSAEIWNKIATQLADQFNVFTYDVRGTGLSDIPERQIEYGFDYLVNDLKAVLEKVSPNQTAHIVGHDWGALQAWEAVLGDRLKSHIKSYTALAPSLDHVGWWFRRQFEQGTFEGYTNVLKRVAGSSYMAMFQIPILPELTWRLGLSTIWPKLIASMEKTSVETDVKQLRNATSGLGLYRQNLLQPLFNPSTRTTSIPVQMLLMTKDTFLPESMSFGMEEWVSNIQYHEIKAGHWGILSHSTEISDHIHQYITKQKIV